MHHCSRGLAALLGLAALASPVAASAKDHRPGRARGHERARLQTFVFAGVYAGEDAVAVRGGNRRARSGGFVGRLVSFDLREARISVADASGDGVGDAADLASGDRVVVQARLPRELRAADAGVLVARRVVDRTRPETDDRDDAAEDEDRSERGAHAEGAPARNRT